MLIKYSGYMAVLALATTQFAATQFVTPQLAVAGDITVKVIEPGAGEKSATQSIGDDRVVAILSYNAIETTQFCNGPVGSSWMKITVHADGAYTGMQTSSRIVCPGTGVQVKEKHLQRHGNLSIPALAKLMSKLEELAPESRELAGSTTESAERGYVTTIKVSRDLRGVFEESDPSLKMVTQTGNQAKISAEFMQKFLQEQKID